MMDGVDWTLFGIDGPMEPLMDAMAPTIGFVIMVGVLLALSVFVVRLLTKDN